MKLVLQNQKGQKIIGVLEKPAGKIKGTCVVQHGWNSNKESPTIQAVKNAFLESGFQTFNFDTTNSLGESDGNYKESTLELHWKDLKEVVLWVQKQDWFSEPLALAGHSMGGYSVVRYAEEAISEVKYLVPVAPLISGVAFFEMLKTIKPKTFARLKERGLEKLRNNEESDVAKKGYWFQIKELEKHNLLSSVSRLTMPTLLISGANDKACPIEHTRVLFNKIPSDVKEFIIIENVSHNFYKKTAQEECTSAIKKWLSNLPKKQT